MVHRLTVRTTRLVINLIFIVRPRLCQLVQIACSQCIISPDSATKAIENAPFSTILCKFESNIIAAILSNDTATAQPHKGHKHSAKKKPDNCQAFENNIQFLMHYTNPTGCSLIVSNDYFQLIYQYQRKSCQLYLY